MGQKVITWYNNLDKKIKLAFLVTFAMGLLIHIYKFTNALPGHDSLYNYYDSQKTVRTGRWLLKIICGMSSYFTLPWINGILALVFIALTAAIITDIFKMKNPVLIILAGGILVSHPSMPETFLYDFLTDGYMLAMFLAALAVRLSLLEEKSRLRKLLSGIMVCLTCAIYQSFVSFAMVLALCYFANELLENKHTAKECGKWICDQLCIYAGGLAVYYIIWKVLITVQNITVTSYQGIADVGISISVIFGGFKKTLDAFLRLLFEHSMVSTGINLYSILNVIFMGLSVVVFVITILKSQIYKERLAFVLLLLSVVAMPFATCIWIFTSEGVSYRPMMMQGICIIFIWIAVLCERWCKQYLKDTLALLMAIIVFNSSLQANISYYYLERCYETTYAIGAEMMARIHMLEEEADSIAVVGNVWNEVTLIQDPLAQKNPHLTRLMEKSFLYDHIHTVLFLEHTFHMDLEPIATEELIRWEEKEEVKNMATWPEAGSIQVLDQTVVIKLSN